MIKPFLFSVTLSCATSALADTIINCPTSAQIYSAPHSGYYTYSANTQGIAWAGQGTDSTVPGSGLAAVEPDSHGNKVLHCDYSAWDYLNATNYPNASQCTPTGSSFKCP